MNTENATLTRAQGTSPALCENCGTALQGVYCHQCGQSCWTTTRFFGSVLADLLENLFSYDSRAVRTLPRLLFAPGGLCNDYLQGKRVRYLPPFRLYLFASIVFFLIAPMLNTITVNPQGNLEFNFVSNQEIEEAHLSSSLKDKLKKVMISNPREFLRKILNSLPTTMFLLLPVIALLLKGLYLFSGRYYMEHLITVLFAQSYLFLMLLIALLLDKGQETLAGALPLQVYLNVFSHTIVRLCFLVIPVQLLFMLKQVYRQSMAVTIIKFGILSFSYFILMLLVFVLAVVWNVVTI